MQAFTKFQRAGASTGGTFAVKIAAITKLKHGGLWSALKALGWSQRTLAEKSNCDYTTLCHICNLVRRPSPADARKIEKAFVEAGENFDAEQEWPETFHGFGGRIQIEQIGEIDQRQLEAVKQHYLNLELDAIPDTMEYYEEGLQQALNNLTERQALVLRERFGFNGKPKTLEEVGELLGVGGARVRQIEAKAMRNLRHPRSIKLIVGEDINFRA